MRLLALRFPQLSGNLTLQHSEASHPWQVPLIRRNTDRQLRLHRQELKPLCEPRPPDSRMVSQRSSSEGDAMKSQHVLAALPLALGIATQAARMAVKPPSQIGSSTTTTASTKTNAPKNFSIPMSN